MKKTLLFACTFLSLATIAQAQIKKGSLLLGGGIGVSNSKTETESYETKTTSLYLAPSVGIAIKDNWVIGMSAGFYDYYNKPQNPDYKSSQNSFSVGVFGRRYLPLSNSFYLYGQGALDYFNEKNKQENIANNTSTNVATKRVNAGISPGIAYAVSKRLHLEAFLNNLLSLSYARNENEYIFTSSTSFSKSRDLSFGANFNTAAPLTVGFRFVLGK